VRKLIISLVFALLIVLPVALPLAAQNEPPTLIAILAPFNIVVPTDDDPTAPPGGQAQAIKLNSGTTIRVGVRNLEANTDFDVLVGNLQIDIGDISTNVSGSGRVTITGIDIPVCTPITIGPVRGLFLITPQDVCLGNPEE